MIHHHVVIVGGGEAGLSVAGRLLNECSGMDVAIIEPSEQHDCQRLWLMVGSGVIRPEASRRGRAPLIPQGAHWIKDAVISFDPDNHCLTTASGDSISYRYLVVAPGIQMKWDRVRGLRGILGRDGVCSAYKFETLVATREIIRDFTGGVALFSQPAGQIKCPTGSQEMCYMAEEHFRHSGVRANTQMILVSGETALFPVPQYSKLLDQLAIDKGVAVHLGLDLVEVRPASKEAVFRQLTSGEERVLRYDLLHVAPPMGPFDFVAQSDLADEGGWVDVDPNTLQHARFPNVFSLGDASSLPTTKTAAAIRQQVPVLVSNLLASLERRPLSAQYDGFSLCNLVTGSEGILRAEMGYCGLPIEDCVSRLLNLSPPRK